MKTRIIRQMGTAFLALAVVVMIPLSVWSPDREPITPTNAHELTQVGVFGYGYSTDGDWAPDGKTLAVATGQPNLISQGYNSAVYSLAFSPDLNTVASGDGSGTVLLWDVATMTERATLHGHTGWVRSVAFSPDGTLLASGSGDRTVRLWNPATGELVHVIEGLSGAVSGSVTIRDNDGDVTLRPAVYSDAVWSVAFSPDGTTLAVGRGDSWAGPGSFQLYDAATGELLADVEPAHVHAPLAVSVYGLTFSPDGSHLATANGDGTVRLWDAIAVQERTILGQYKGWVGSVAFSPDGKLLASGGVRSTCDYGMICLPENEHGEIRVWDVVTGEQTALLEGHVGGVQSVAFSPDGNLLASVGGGNEDAVRLWDTATGKVLAELDSVTFVLSLAFNADGSLVATGGEDGIVRLWGVPVR